MASMTLIEWMKTVQDPIRRGIIETLYTEEPIFQYIPFRSIAGLALPYTKESALPGVAFRQFNAAFTPTVGVVQRDVETLKPFGGDSLTDKVFVDAHGNAERTSRDKMFAKAMALKYVQTMLYGNSVGGRAGAAYTDANGFDGFEARVQAAQQVDGGGTTGSDGSSVFFIRFGDGYCQGLQTSAGLDARDLGEQGSTEGPMLLTRIDHTAGLAIYNGASVSWINNLRAATTVLTCSMMDDAADLITGKATIIVMSKRSRKQLKTDAKGAGFTISMTLDELSRPVPSWDGVPILISDAIINTETNS